MADFMFSLGRIGISNRIRLPLVSQQDFLARRISRLAPSSLFRLTPIRGRSSGCETPIFIGVDLPAGAFESTRSSKLRREQGVCLNTS